MLEYDVNSYCGLTVITQMSGSVFPQAFLPACLSILVALLVLLQRGDFDDADALAQASTNSSEPQVRVFHEFLRHPYPHQISSVMIGFMMVFRVQLSYQRYWEGISEMTDMFTKWYDAAVQVCAFDELSVGEAAENGPAFRKHAIHLFSLMSTCSVLELKREKLEILTMQPRDEGAKQPLQLPILRRAIGLEPPEPDYGGRDKIAVTGGFFEGELEHLQAHAPHFVDCVMARLVRLISIRVKEGGMNIPPPVVSRVYQELSNGAIGFHQSEKIARVPFPFPYAQLLAIMKVYFILTVPIAVVAFTDEPGFAIFMSFFTSFIFVSLNEVAIELEDPFGNDANDLPLQSMLKSFNRALEHLLHQEAPEEDNLKSATYMKLQSGIRATLRRTAGKGMAPGAAAGAAGAFAATSATSAAPPVSLAARVLAAAKAEEAAAGSEPNGGTSGGASSGASGGASPPPLAPAPAVAPGGAKKPNLMAALAAAKSTPAVPPAPLPEPTTTALAASPTAAAQPPPAPEPAE